MDNQSWVILAAVVVVVVVVGGFLARRLLATRREHARGRAAELREQAEATHQAIAKKQAGVDAAEARAREMRAEADRKQAEAKRLEAEVADQRSTLHEHVQRRDDLRAQADRLDPDVDADAEPDTESHQSSGQHRG